MPQATPPRPPAAPINDSKPWHVVNKHVSFLEAGGDFTIVCKDSSWNGKPNPNGALTAFRISSEVLESASPMFRAKPDVCKIINNPTLPGGKVYRCQESSEIVAILLCATADSENPWVRDCKDWEKLSEALRLASYWYLSKARLALFFKLMALVQDRNWHLPSEPLDVTPYFAEAASGGSASMAAASSLFTARVKLAPQRKAIQIRHHRWWCRIWMELGPDGCSEVANAVLVLVKDGIFEPVEA